jgi:hypothetical protein
MIRLPSRISNSSDFSTTSGMKNGQAGNCAGSLNTRFS